MPRDKKKFQFVSIAAQRELQSLPDTERSNIGYQLGEVQKGEEPDDFKPMSIVGSGV
jgi:phage-related protein